MNTSLRPQIYRLCSVVTLIILSCLPLKAQTEATAVSSASDPNLSYTCSHIAFTDETSFGYVRDVIQDTTGLLWITSSHGLFLFDGKKIVNYFKDSPGEDFRIYYTLHAIETKQRNLAISNGYSDIYLFNPYTRKLKKTIHSASKFHVYDLVMAEDGAIWVITRNPNDPTFNQVLKTEPNIELSDNTFDSLKIVEQTTLNNWPQLIDHDNKVFVSTASSVRSYHYGGGLNKVYPLEDGPFEVRPMVFAKNTDGELFVKSNHKVETNEISAKMFFLDSSERFVDYALVDKNLGHNCSFIKFIGDELWLGGVYRTLRMVNTKTKKVEDYSDLIKKIIPKDYYILGVFKDASDQLWVTTNGGLIKLTKKKEEVFNVNFSESDGFCNETCIIQSIVGDADNMYCSYLGSVVKLNKKTKEKTRLNYTIDKKELNSVKNLSSDLGGSNLSLYKDQLIWHDQLIDLESNQGLDLLDSNPDFRVVNGLVNKDKLWLAPYYPTDSASVLYIYDLEQKTLKNISPSIPIIPDFLPSKILESAYSDNVWVLTQNMGIWVFDKKGKFKNVIEPVLFERWCDIYEADQHNLWISAWGGLVNLDPTINSFKSYPIILSRFGGVDTKVMLMSIAKHKDHLWCAGEKGVYRFNLKVQEFDTPKMPLPLRQLNGTNVAQYVDQDKIYFGSLSGLYSFYSDSVEIAEEEMLSPFPIRINSYSVFNRNAQEPSTHHDAFDLKKIELTDGNLWFSFDFSLPHYKSPKDIVYSYKLEGFDEAWSIPSNNSTLKYTKVSPGSYELKLRAGLDLDHLKLHERSIGIDIKRAWYKTWWFFALCAIGLGLPIYAIMRYRFNQKLKQRIAIETVRTKLSHDLHDEVGSILTGIAMQTEILALEKEDKPISKNLNEIRGMSISAMEYMRDIVWALDTSKGKYVNLIDRMEDYARAHLKKKGIGFHFEVDKNLANRQMEQSLKQQFYLIYKEAITNIIKHSDADQVNISLELNGDKINLVIHDNGSPSKQETFSGIGMTSMKKRAEDMGGLLRVDKSSGYKISVLV